MNTSVVPPAAISRSTGSSIWMPRCPPQGKRPGVSGSSVSISMALSMRPCTSTPSSCASSARIASALLPSVALRPHTGGALAASARTRASASCTCTPRLPPISSCHSSTTTSCTPASNCGASARASSSVRLSGVVTSASGNWRPWRVRSALSVSPVRTPTVQSSPRSASGASSAREVSADSARMGVIHSSRRPPPGTSPASARLSSANHSA